MSVRKVIEACYQAYGKRDFDGTMLPFSDDVKFDWPANPSQSKRNGCCTGKQAMIDRLADLAQEFEYLDVRLHSLIVDGDHAAARVSMKLKQKETGAEFTNQSAHFWTFEEGRCVELTEYYDTALLKAYGG